MRKLLCSGTFGLALLCFCLPWVSVSCQQQKVMRATGIELVSGLEVSEPGGAMFGGATKKHKVEPNAIAIVALVAAIISFCLSVAGGRASALPALAGIATAIALKVSLDQDILKQGQGLFEVNYESGFLGYLVLMAIGLITSLVPDTSGSAQLYADATERDTRTCPQCAEVIKKDAIVCKHCGARVVAEETPAGAATDALRASGLAGSGRMEAAQALGTSPGAAGRESAARFCSQCGTEIVEGAIFCCECGVRVCAKA